MTKNHESDLKPFNYCRILHPHTNGSTGWNGRGNPVARFILVHCLLRTPKQAIWNEEFRRLQSSICRLYVLYIGAKSCKNYVWDNVLYSKSEFFEQK